MDRERAAMGDDSTDERLFSHLQPLVQRLLSLFRRLIREKGKTTRSQRVDVALPRAPRIICRDLDALNAAEADEGLMELVFGRRGSQISNMSRA